MKKKTPKILIFITAIIIMLTSCLSENDNSIESGRDIAYITTIDNIVCAATSSGYITSPTIHDLKQKECYTVAYRITNPDANGIYTADKMTNISGEPLPQTELREGTPALKAEHGLAAVKELSIPIFAATNYMGDRWVFNYIASAKENEDLLSYFYYNKDNQVDKDGINIANDNKIIIDILFQQPEEPGTKATDKKYLTVGNLENLRTLYTPDFSKLNGQNTDESVAVLIQFRYHKYINENKPSEESFLGTWNTNSQNRAYYMTFVKNKQ